MRDAFLALTFFSLIPFAFTKGPFVGVLIYFWTSLMSPQFLVWGFAASIPYTLIAACATIISWLTASEISKLPPLDNLTILLVGMMIWMSLTALFGSGSPETVYFYWSNSEKMLLMTLLTYALISSRDRVNQILLVCSLSIAYYGFKGGIWTLLNGGQDRVFGPPGGMIEDNNLLGVALTTTLPILLYVHRWYCKPCLKIPMVVFIGFTIVGDLFTYSRGAFLALSVMAAVTWLRSRQKAMLAVLAIGIATGVWFCAPAHWFARMETIQTYDQDASAQQRLYMWQLSWAMAIKHPILGGGAGWPYNVPKVNEEFASSGLHWPFGGTNEVGYEFSEREAPTLIRPRAAHSIWFQIVSDQGFPGLLLFVWILLVGVNNARWLVRHARGRKHLASVEHLGRALQASLIGYVVGGSFASLATYDLLYVIVAITGAARHVVVRETRLEPTVAENAETVPLWRGSAVSAFRFGRTAQVDWRQ